MFSAVQSPISLPIKGKEVFSVPLLDGETFYSIYGDYPLYGFLSVLGGCLILARMRKSGAS